jgi:hypothetical protein
MPFAFAIVGIVLLIAGVRDKQDELYETVKGDFTGKGSYVAWMVSILIIGGLGYIEQIRPISRAFLVLILVGLIIRNGGFFQKFNQQVFAPLPSGTDEAKALYKSQSEISF